MRKWHGNRRRRSAEDNPPPGQGQTPPEQEQSDDVREAGDSPVRSTSGELPQESSDMAPAPQRSSRNRGRRRKKKSGAAPSAVKSQPIIPAYTASEGPRAPSPVAVSPGAPTGEAAELEMPPAERPPQAASQPATPPPAKRVPKGAVVLSVGLPGSGKTTWFKRKGVTPLSSDLLRTLLFDNSAEQRHQDLVFSSLRSLLRARLMARMPMNYVDATNLSPKERRHWIRMAREFGYELHAVYFEVPLETCLERNRKRQRVVPEEVMQRMAAKLRPPTFEEGFSKIIVVRVKNRPATEHPAPETSEPEPILAEAVTEASDEAVAETNEQAPGETGEDTREGEE